MLKIGQSLAVIVITLALLAGLFALNPFQRASDALDWMFGAPPKWALVSNLYRDAHTQEITHGDDPAPGLKLLAEYWKDHPGRRIVFAGNSQMHTINLAAGEARPSEPEKTYVDLISDELDRQGEHVYRLANSGMSYPEVLWELVYMFKRPELKADAVVLQMNYQAFWTGGIRDSMLPLLDDTEFRHRIEQLASANTEYAPALRDALNRYSERKSRENSKDEEPAGHGLFTPTNGFGYEIESQSRMKLERYSSFHKRAQFKEDFAQMLYRARSYFLNLKPSTARSISGQRLLAARAAIEEIAAECRRNNAQLVLFHAPVNPNVSLYRTDADRASYRHFVEDVAKTNGIPLYDFEASIPGAYWGKLLNGPDPLHMGRKAHKELARLMMESMQLAAKAETKH